MVLQGSVAGMIFAAGWFDLVTAFEAVYFWPDLPRSFREVYRVLKPGGTFFICNECSDDTGHRTAHNSALGAPLPQPSRGTLWPSPPARYRGTPKSAIECRR